MEDKPVGEPRAQIWGPGCGRGNWGHCRADPAGGSIKRSTGPRPYGPAGCIGTLPVMVLFVTKGLPVYFWAQSIT